MRKTALITGITGQDGSYLTEFLLSHDYEVHGLVRRSSTSGGERLRTLAGDSARLHLHLGDLGDASSLERVVREVEPDEVYNLGAQSHVHASFDVPAYTADCVALGTVRLLEAVRALRDRTGRPVRFYQASSSEMFGAAAESPQDETTPFRPRSPYGAAKAHAHWAAVNYREAYGLHTSCGILFNHESPRRGEGFVTRKVTRAVGRIRHGLQDELRLGNLDARRDWGFAGDYVEAMWRMLRHDTPGDWVVATGRAHSVRELVEVAFAAAGLDWREHVRMDPACLRPTDVEHLVGNAAKARRELDWRPRVSFADMIARMVAADSELARCERRSGRPQLGAPAPAADQLSNVMNQKKVFRRSPSLERSNSNMPKGRIESSQQSTDSRVADGSSRLS